MDLLWNGENKVKIQLLCHMPFPHRTTNDDGCGGGSSFSQAKERFFNAFHGGLKGGGLEWAMKKNKVVVVVLLEEFYRPWLEVVRIHMWVVFVVYICVNVCSSIN